MSRHRHTAQVTGAVLALVSTAVFPVQPVLAEDLTVDQIVERANRVAYYQGADGSADVKMVITDSQGRTREREFTVLRWDAKAEGSEGDEYCGEQKFYVYFERPADVRKMAFMVWKHLDKDDDRWLYLPALDLAKRLAASDKRTSFVGSDFFYEDVSGRGIAEDNHELVEATDEFYVVKNTPRNPDSVEFAHYTTWIDRQTFLPMKSEYVDKAGNYYRGHKVIKSETIDGKPTVTKAEMVSLKTASKTVVEYSKIRYDVGLPEDIFTERYLRRAPRKHLR